MNKKLLWIFVILSALLYLPSATEAQERSYSATNFDSEVTVEEGGSLLVTETIVFDFVGGPFTFVFRHLPTDLTDGITVIEASVDGEVYPPGENAGQVEIDGGNTVEVEWHLEPTQNSQRTFQLVYRVEGVLRQEEGVDRLKWQPLPDDYEYFIAESETVITFPAAVELLQDPVVETGEASIEISGNRVVFSAQNLEPDTPLIVEMGFEPGRLITTPPDWQVLEAENAARFPFYAGGGIATLLAGLIGLVAVIGRNFIQLTAREMGRERPDKLAPGIAGPLLTPTISPNWQTAQGTLFKLAEEGVLVIEESKEKKWWEKHAFDIIQVDLKTRTIPYEEKLLSMLFEDKHGRLESVPFSKAASNITGEAWKRYKEEIEIEIETAGYLDSSRQHMRRQLTIVGSIFTALASAGIIIGLILNHGAGPFVVVGALFALGITAFIGSSMITPLSLEGIETAKGWKRFRNYLKAISSGKEPIDNPAIFEKYLPYAAAFGLLGEWSKRFEKEGTHAVPAYFKLHPTTPIHQAWPSYMAMQSSINSSGGNASGGGAGGAGVGAAGGGASGAG
ncbi:MAG: DUF2207 domain-containing protein [Chloroflexota bacterium]